MKKRNDLTQDEVRKLFDYDPETGEVRWKVERYRKHPGDIAGCVYTVDGKRYKRVSVSVNYRRYLLHRIIWLWVTGCWPIDELDHIDGDATNNRWANLREANRHQNGKNISAKVNSLIGINGVSFDKKRGNYRARIMVDRKDIYLGNFASIEEATRVRQVASKKYFGSFARE